MLGYANIAMGLFCIVLAMMSSPFDGMSVTGLVIGFSNLFAGVFLTS